VKFNKAFKEKIVSAGSYSVSPDLLDLVSRIITKINNVYKIWTNLRRGIWVLIDKIYSAAPNAILLTNVSSSVLEEAHFELLF